MERHEVERMEQEAQQQQQAVQMQAAFYFQQMQEGKLSAEQLQALTGMDADQLHVQIIALAQEQQQAAQAAGVVQQVQQEAGRSTEKTKICRYFLEGTCHRGDSCTYYHPKPDSGIGPAAPGGQDDVGSGSSYQIEWRNATKTKVCKYFQEKGRCSKGDGCTFLHVPPDPNAQPPEDDWMCPCGFANRARNLICGGHGGRKGCKASKPRGKLVTGAFVPNKVVGWTCSCGFENRPENIVCGGSSRAHLGCKAPKPDVAAVLPNEDSFMFLPSKCQKEEEVLQRIMESVHAQQALAQAALPTGMPNVVQPEDEEPPAKKQKTLKEKRAEENRRKPCAIFMISPAMCQDEAQCGFSHDPSLVAAARAEEGVAPESSFIPCKLYLEGCCNKGADCGFFHDPALAPLGSEPEPPKETKVAETKALTDPHGRNLPKPTKEICKMFLEGCCNLGAACPFFHEGETEAPVVASSSTARVAPAEPPAAKSSKGSGKKKGACKWWVQKGYCTKGEDCPYSHSKDDTAGVDKFDFAWQCPCGFKNVASNSICGGPKGELGCKAPRPAHNPEPYGDWTCGACGFRNSVINKVCGGLGPYGCKLPKTEPAQVAQVAETPFDASQLALLAQAAQLDQQLAMAEFAQAQAAAQAPKVQQPVATLPQAAGLQVLSPQQQLEQGAKLSGEVLQYLQFLTPDQLQAYLEELSPEQLQLLQQLAPDKFEELMNKWKQDGGEDQLLDEGAPPAAPPDAGQQGKGKDGKGNAPSQPPEPVGEWWTCPSCGWANRPENMVCGGSSPSSGCKIARPSPSLENGVSTSSGAPNLGGGPAMTMMWHQKGGGDMLKGSKGGDKGGKDKGKGVKGDKFDKGGKGKKGKEG